MSKVVELIKQDHRKVEELFKAFKRTNDYAVAQQICAELTAHALLEEEMLYPVLRQEVNQEDTDYAQEEHDEAKRLIARIQALRPDSPELKTAMQKLEEGISHHVEEEENEILPRAENEVLKQLKAMEAKFIERKQQLVGTIVEQGPGATGADTLVDLTRDELYQQAQELDIAGRSEMNKQQLAQALHAAGK